MVYLIRTTDEHTFEEFEVVDTDDRKIAIFEYADRMRFMESGLSMMLLYSATFNPDEDRDSVNPMDICEVVIESQCSGEYQR